MMHWASEIGAHVAIIGGGFIGLELAASARARGANVTVVEALPRVLSRGVPEEIATFLANRHRAEGVTIMHGSAIAAIQGQTCSVTITLGGGDRVSADCLVVGIGAVPAVRLAKEADLALSDGIAVNDYLQTTDPEIFAAGDCCSFVLPIYNGRRIRLESWRNAQDQGELAARNMLGANESMSRLPWVWSDQYDLTLQIVGLPDEGTHTVRRQLLGSALILFHLTGDGRLVAASGIGTGHSVARDIRLAEMLIARQARPEPRELQARDIKLKTLLAVP